MISIMILIYLVILVVVKPFTKLYDFETHGNGAIFFNDLRYLPVDHKCSHFSQYSLKL